jgi:hypothetical protein
MAKSSSSSKSAVYEIRTTFRAPLRYVYRWCTDYTPNDARLEKDEYDRKIVKRGARTVVYEDLYESPAGWMWSHQEVTLHPPDRWHAESTGSHRTWSLDYTLRPLPNGRTELTLRGTRRPTALGEPNPPAARMERDLRRAWANFGHSLEKDFRKHQRRG